MAPNGAITRVSFVVERPCVACQHPKVTNKWRLNKIGEFALFKKDLKILLQFQIILSIYSWIFCYIKWYNYFWGVVTTRGYVTIWWFCPTQYPLWIDPYRELLNEGEFTIIMNLKILVVNSAERGDQSVVRWRSKLHSHSYANRRQIAQS